MTSIDPPPRGLLVVIEGLDRSGKSTQCQTLVSRLQSGSGQQQQQHHAPRARLQKFPDRSTPTGTLINSYLTNQTDQDDHAIHLLFSSNRWEARGAILASLRQGTTVVVDRYSFSGAVYSAAKRNPDLGLAWAWAPEVGLPRPDLVVFLDLELDLAEARGGFGDERYERREMQTVVRALFGDVLGRARAEQGVRVEVVDAGRGVEEVSELVWNAWERALKDVREMKGPEGEVGKLMPLEM